MHGHSPAGRDSVQRAEMAKNCNQAAAHVGHQQKHIQHRKGQSNVGTTGKRARPDALLSLGMHAKETT